MCIALIWLLSTNVLAATEFCSRIEAGSAIDADVINVRTSTSSSFVLSSERYPIQLNHEIQVTEAKPGIPSSGGVSAYLNALVQNGDRQLPSLKKVVEYHESTSILGKITYLEKILQYRSG